MSRFTRIAVAAVVALLAVDAGAYVIAGRSVFKRFAMKQALDRAQSTTLVGRAFVNEGPGREREFPAKLELKLPGGCRAQLEMPEGDAAASLEKGKVGTEGAPVPALAAFVALGCPLSSMKNVPAADAEVNLVRLAGGFGVDIEIASLSRLNRRAAWVVGAKPKELDKPQLWFDKETNRPVRVIAKHGGEMWDVRFEDAASLATGHVHPRLAEVWRGGERQLALRLMTSDGTGIVDDLPPPPIPGEGDEEE